jgi:tetratricopeptide (TPR) repeat protein
MSGIGDDEGERLWGRGGPKLDDDDDDDEYDDNGNAYDGEESDPLASDDDADVTRDEEAEELFGASVETLLAERNGGKRRRRASGARGAKRRPSEVPRHLTARMGAATVAYMKQNFAEAEELLLKIIQEAPKAVDPYKNLALICEERGDMEKSLSYLMFAAHLDRQDRDLWKRCASRWFEAGDNDQAIYCLTMALKGTNGQDTEALRARAAVFEAASQWRKAGENYVKLLKAEPGNLGVAIQLCNVFIKDGKPLKAEPYLEQTLSYLEQYPPKFTQRDDILAHEASLSTVVQRIVEIRFSQDRYEDAAKLLAHHQSRRTLGDIQPFLERVMHGVCQHRVGSRALASVTFNEFFADEGMSKANPTLMWHVAEACFAGRDHLKTIKAYSALIGHPEYTQQPRMFLRRAEAYMQLGNAVQAEKDVRRALDIVPESVEAKVYLSRITGEAGSRSLRTGDGSQAGATGLGSREIVTPHPAGGRRDMLRDALYATEQSVQRQKPPKKKDSVNVLLALVADLAAAAKSALDKGGVAPYLSVLGPPVEAALGLPDGVLRSNWTDESVLVGDCIQQDLIAKVQVMGEDLKALGQAFLRSLSDTAYVAFLERVLDCTMLHGAFGDGTNVVEVLAAARGHRIRSGERCLKLRTRAACLASMICGGDIERAYDDMRNLVRDYPSDTRIWWLHAQFDPYLTSLRDPGFRSRINQSLTRDAKREFKDPSFGAASIGSVMASGVYSVRGRGHMITPRPAARCFAFVHRRVPEVPSAALGVAVNLLSMARSRSAVNREQLILKAFTYMDEYRRRRRQQFESMPRCTQMFGENEIDYNVARALHDIGLVYLAADLYSCILDGSRGAELDGQTDVSSESALDLLPAWLDIRREAAFNLVHIYEASGQSELAGALVRKYLVF